MYLVFHWLLAASGVVCIALNAYQIFVVERSMTVPPKQLQYIFHRSLPTLALFTMVHHVLLCVDVMAVDIKYLFLVDFCVHFATLLGLFHLYWVGWSVMQSASITTKKASMRGSGGIDKSAEATAANRLTWFWTSVSVFSTVALVVSFILRAIYNLEYCIGVFLLSMIVSIVMVLASFWICFRRLQNIVAQHVPSSVGDVLAPFRKFMLWESLLFVLILIALIMVLMGKDPTAVYLTAPSTSLGFANTSLAVAQPLGFLIGTWGVWLRDAASRARHEHDVEQTRARSATFALDVADDDDENELM